MNKSILKKGIVAVGFLVLIVLVNSFCVYVSFKNKASDTVIQYKGIKYALYGLVGEGRTFKNIIPVFHPVFVPLEDRKRAY